MDREEILERLEEVIRQFGKAGEDKSWARVLPVLLGGTDAAVDLLDEVIARERVPVEDVQHIKRLVWAR